MPLSVEQVQIIKSTVPVLAEHGNAITTSFYSTMLKENPVLYNIFSRTNQDNGHQPRALAAALYAYAANIDNLAVLGPAVELMCQRHASLFIRPEHYDIVGRYLLAAMGSVLGSALTPDVLDAWTAAYTQLANLMAGREKELYTMRPDWTDWRDFVIKKKVKEADDITSFYLEPVDGQPLPLFKPGQYISVRVDIPELKHMQARQYSLSEAPRADYYRISTKREDGLDLSEPQSRAHPGYVSTVLHRLKNQGDIIQVSAPRGEFFLDLEDKTSTSPVVLISGGVGLTPMLSMLNSLVAQESPRPISWIHSARSVSAQAFAAHVREVCESHTNIHETIFISNPSGTDVHNVDYHHQGRLDLAKVERQKDLFLADRTTEYYICGPDGFMEDMRRALKNYSVDDSRIKAELFGTGSLPGPE
jgi:nitric oxide dioxygenase